MRNIDWEYAFLIAFGVVMSSLLVLLLFFAVFYDKGTWDAACPDGYVFTPDSGWNSQTWCISDSGQTAVKPTYERVDSGWFIK